MDGIWGWMDLGFREGFGDGFGIWKNCGKLIPRGSSTRMGTRDPGKSCSQNSRGGIPKSRDGISKIQGLDPKNSGMGDPKSRDFVPKIQELGSQKFRYKVPKIQDPTFLGGVGESQFLSPKSQIFLPKPKIFSPNPKFSPQILNFHPQILNFYTQIPNRNKSQKILFYPGEKKKTKQQNPRKKHKKTPGIFGMNSRFFLPALPGD